MTGKYSSIELYNIKKDLITNIKSLSRDEHVQIFCIIKKAKVKYTENNNGIFINMKILEQSCLNDVYEFLNFIKNKN